MVDVVPLWLLDLWGVGGESGWGNGFCEVKQLLDNHVMWMYLLVG